MRRDLVVVAMVIACVLFGGIDVKKRWFVYVERCEIRRKTGVGRGEEEWEWKSEGWQEAGCEGRCLGLLVVGLVVVSRAAGLMFLGLRHGLRARGTLFLLIIAGLGEHSKRHGYKWVCDPGTGNSVVTSQKRRNWR